MMLYGLLGKTLKHSFSKTYFTKKFNELGIEGYRYDNFELENIGQLTQLLKSTPQLKGLNVTIPYKEDVMPFLDFKNDIVESIQACNCIKISDGKLYGYNTDVVGFKQSLLQYLKPYHKQALILGTGGAAKAVQLALKQLGILYKTVSRKSGEGFIGYNDLDAKLFQNHLLVINTSPVGMYPAVNEAPQIPYEAITGQHLLFDLIYNPEKTLFLQKGEEQGATIVNGYEMLVLQAEESWRIWNS